ncbi:hypothetical protein AVEN_125592-1 [Araneus ventricosus]|uniref:Uncharacterized protein n=1 Tax=Araneus ventricosus TaxID=182803 RepID=A0A4Y2MZ21_ARAVE|nr:hypothetical protein AVEN_125592-1 [Araneus ventricosus]
MTDLLLLRHKSQACTEPYGYYRKCLVSCFCYTNRKCTPSLIAITASDWFIASATQIAGVYRALTYDWPNTRQLSVWSGFEPGSLRLRSRELTTRPPRPHSRFGISITNAKSQLGNFEIVVGVFQ